MAPDALAGVAFDQLGENGGGASEELVLRLGAWGERMAGTVGWGGAAEPLSDLVPRQAVGFTVVRTGQARVEADRLGFGPVGQPGAVGRWLRDGRLRGARKRSPWSRISRSLRCCAPYVAGANAAAVPLIQGPGLAAMARPPHWPPTRATSRVRGRARPMIA